MALFAENNATGDDIPLTLDHIDKLSGILEPSAEVLATQIESFGTNMTIFITVLIAMVSIFGYLGFLKPVLERSKSMEEKIEKHFDKIETAVKREVQSQIIYGIDGELDKALTYAERKIDSEVQKVKEDAQAQMFDYQELVYEVNQNIRIESEEIFSHLDMDTEAKLNAIISLQYQYNEITNHYLPKLFSKSLLEVIPTAKQLSEYKHIKSVIKLHLLSLMHNSSWSSIDKEELNKVIKKYYK
jgi:hypothetical protein